MLHLLFASLFLVILANVIATIVVSITAKRLRTLTLGRVVQRRVACAQRSKRETKICAGGGCHRFSHDKRNSGFDCIKANSRLLF